jgi:hypothetical protein
LRRAALAAVLVAIALAVPGTCGCKVLSRSGPDDLANAERILRLEPPFIHYGGFGYIAQAPVFNKLADTIEDNYQSPLLLFENNTLLGPAHSLHADIAAAGAGRFSHWANGLFSQARTASLRTRREKSISSCCPRSERCDR